MSNGAGGPAPGAPPREGRLGVGVGMGRWVPALGFVGLVLGPQCSGVGVMVVRKRRRVRGGSRVSLVGEGEENRRWGWPVVFLQKMQQNAGYNTGEQEGWSAGTTGSPCPYMLSPAVA